MQNTKYSLTPAVATVLINPSIPACLPVTKSAINAIFISWRAYYRAEGGEQCRNKVEALTFEFN